MQITHLFSFQISINRFYYCCFPFPKRVKFQTAVTTLVEIFFEKLVFFQSKKRPFIAKNNTTCNQILLLSNINPVRPIR